MDTGSTLVARTFCVSQRFNSPPRQTVNAAVETGSPSPTPQ